MNTDINTYGSYADVKVLHTVFYVLNKRPRQGFLHEVGAYLEKRGSTGGGQFSSKGWPTLSCTGSIFGSVYVFVLTEHLSSTW